MKYNCTCEHIIHDGIAPEPECIGQERQREKREDSAEREEERREIEHGTAGEGRRETQQTQHLGTPRPDIQLTQTLGDEDRERGERERQRERITVVVNCVNCVYIIS